MELAEKGKRIFFPDHVFDPANAGLLGPFVPRGVAQAAVHVAAGFCAFRLVIKDYETLAPFRRRVIDEVVMAMPPTSRKVRFLLCLSLACMPLRRPGWYLYSTTCAPRCFLAQIRNYKKVHREKAEVLSEFIMTKLCEYPNNKIIKQCTDGLNTARKQAFSPSAEAVFERVLGKVAAGRTAEDPESVSSHMERVVHCRDAADVRRADVIMHKQLRTFASTLISVFRRSCPSRLPADILAMKGLIVHVSNADFVARTGVFLCAVLMREAGIEPVAHSRTHRASFKDDALMVTQHKVCDWSRQPE